MPQSLHALNTHIIFSTKGRQPWLTADVQPRAWSYMTGVLNNLECHSMTIGGVEGHIHVLCDLTKKHASMKVVQILKQESSRYIKTLGDELEEFHWQDGYGLFSVSFSHCDAVRNYILNQEIHHQKESFQKEFLRVLKKYRLAYDERYLWD